MSGRKQISNTFTVNALQDGRDGARGKVGRFYYYGGIFNSQDSTKHFVISDAQAPYFEHTENGVKRYHVYNPEENPQGGTLTMSQMWTNSEQSWNNAPWEVMTNDFRYLITEAIFGKYAEFGSFIINENLLFSQYGTLGTTENYNGSTPVSCALLKSDGSAGTVSVAPFTLFDVSKIDTPYEELFKKSTSEIITQETTFASLALESGVLYYMSFWGDNAYITIKKNDVVLKRFSVDSSNFFFMVEEDGTYTFNAVPGPEEIYNRLGTTSIGAATFSPIFVVNGLTGAAYLQNAWGKFRGTCEFDEMRTVKYDSNNVKLYDVKIGGESALNAVDIEASQTNNRKALSVKGAVEINYGDDALSFFHDPLFATDTIIWTRMGVQYQIIRSADGYIKAEPYGV